MQQKSNGKFSRRDQEASQLRLIADKQNLTFISESEDTENYTKSLLFKYRGVLIELSVRSTSTRYPVLIVGKTGEMLFESIPYGMSRTIEGVRIGEKGKSYPRTKEHVEDQIKLLKVEIDKKLQLQGGKDFYLKADKIITAHKK